MKLNFDYKGTKISYELTYKKTNAISIKVNAGGKVNVIAPIGTSVFAVMDKVKGNAPWIISELYKGKEVQAVKQPVKLQEQYAYLGKNYGLEVIKNEEINNIKVKMSRGKFLVETPTDHVADIRNAIIAWYEDKLIAKLKERLKSYKEIFEYVPSDLSVEDDDKMLVRVGKEKMLANVKLAMMPADVIDYILVGSLCQINFGKEQVADKLKEILPEYEKCQNWLQENKGQLSL